MTQRAVCSFFPMCSLNCARLFRPRLDIIFQANRLKLPRANCLKPSLNSRRFWSVGCICYQTARRTAAKIFPPSLSMAHRNPPCELCDRCIGPEKTFFIQSPTLLANDCQAVSWGPICRKPRLPEVTLTKIK